MPRWPAEVDAASARIFADARTAAHAGDWEKARAAFETLFKQNPAELAYAYALAESCLKLGRMKEAIATYQWLAGQFAGKGELLRAIAALQGILRIDPSHGETQKLLADLYARRKAEGAAMLALPAGWTRPPTDEPVRKLKGTTRPPEGWPDAIPLRYVKVPLFSSLSAKAFVQLLGQTRVLDLPEGAVVVKQGERGDSLFAVANGSVRVTKEVAKGQVIELATLPAGSFFGEMALLTGGARRATVTTLAPSELLEIPRPALDALSDDSPTLGETLRRFCRERLLQTALATGILFRDLPPAERDLLVHRFRTLDAKPGTALLKEGEFADGLYVLIDGSAEVKKGKRVLAVLRGGDFCGEMSILSGSVALASVVVKAHATLLKLPRQACEEVFQDRPELLETVQRVAAERRKLNEAILSGSLGQPADGTSPA